MESQADPGWFSRSQLPPRGEYGVVVAGAADKSAQVLADDLGAEHVVRFAGDLGDLHRQLTFRGPFGFIVDASGAGLAVGRLRCASHHLRQGGWALVRLPTRSTPARDKVDDVLGHVERLARSGEFVVPDRKDRRRREEREQHAFAASFGDLEVGGDFVFFRQRERLLARLADSDVDEQAFRLRPSLGAMLTEVPASDEGAHGAFSSTDVDERPLESMRAPRLMLREYLDVTCAPAMVVTTDGMLLPDTFRHPERPFLTHPNMTVWDANSYLSPDLGEPRRLTGRWFYADNVMRGHFGHAMTEQLSKLWGWAEARRRWPDIGVLVTARPGAGELAPWEYELLHAAGVPRDAIRLQTGPVRVETLVAGTPAYEIDGYVHAVMRDVYDRVGASLAARSTMTTFPERVFLTRGPERRQCTNSAEVHGVFAAHGFEIVLPEQLALSDQVALVRHAKVVAGFGGSAMFHTALTSTPKRVLVLSHENYHMANEKHMAALRGHTLSVYRSRPEIPKEDRFTDRAFHSAFAVDFEREGKTLKAALRAL